MVMGVEGGMDLGEIREEEINVIKIQCMKLSKIKIFLS